MTASKNPENTSVQLLNSFGIVLSHLPVWLKTPNHFYQNVDFSSSPILIASAECLKSIENARFEMKDLKKSKTKTMKAKTWKTRKLIVVFSFPSGSCE